MEDIENNKEGFNVSGEGAEEGLPAEERDVESLREALAKKEQEYSELQDKHLRALAEMDNFRKRVAREQTETKKYANEKILNDLLPVIDNMERAIAHSEEKKDFDVLIDGLELTKTEFINILENYGIKYIESVGQSFDPAMHHAVARVESDEHSDSTIVEEFRRGYLLNDRILRPSLVSVAKKKEEPESES